MAFLYRTGFRQFVPDFIRPRVIRLVMVISALLVMSGNLHAQALRFVARGAVTEIRPVTAWVTPWSNLLNGDSVKISSAQIEKWISAMPETHLWKGPLNGLLGMSFKAAQDDKEADRAFRNFIRTEPGKLEIPDRLALKLLTGAYLHFNYGESILGQLNEEISFRLEQTPAGAGPGALMAIYLHCQFLIGEGDYASLKEILTRVKKAFLCDPDKRWAVRWYLAKGNYYFHVGRFYSTLFHYATVHYYSPGKENFDIILNNLATALGEIKDKNGNLRFAGTQALIYRTILSGNTSASPISEIKVAEYESNLALCLSHQKKYPEAESLYQSSLNKYNNSREGVPRENYDHNLLQFGGFLQKTGRPEDALRLYHSSLLENVNGFTNPNPAISPRPVNFTSDNPSKLFNTIGYKAEVYYQKSKRDNKSENLKLAFANYRIAHEWLFTMLEKSYNDGSFLVMESQTRAISGQAIEVCMELAEVSGDSSYLDSAFYFAEINKSLLLQKKTQADSLSRNEKLGEPVSLLELRTAANDSGLAIAEYFVTDSNAFVFLVFPDHSPILQRLKMPRLLDKKISRLRDLLISPNADTSAIFSQLSHQLYQDLLGTPMKNAGVKIPSRLLIIPDAALFFLPFEILLTAPFPQKGNDFRAAPFLLKGSTLRYHFSSSIWWKGKKNSKTQSVGKMLAFSFSAENEAGILKTENNFSHLKDSPTEVNAVMNYYRGSSFYGPAATRQTFLDSARFFDCIHLSLHGTGSGNPNTTCLVFRGANSFKLKLKNIYELKLNARLSVLSACETSLGKNVAGEGAMSLAHGFLYAGSDAVVSSLWSIDDRSTAQLMSRFYNHLASGVTKDKALQLAKLEMIGSDKKFSHPFYWSALVAIGDMSPLPPATGSGENHFYLILLAAGLFALVWWGYRE